MNKKVLVIGSINVDYVIHTDRLPKLGETITGSDFAMNFGGKGANQAVSIAKSGCKVKMLGAVGNDLSGDLAIKNLKSFGVDTSSVIKAGAPTGAAAITVYGGDNIGYTGIFDVKRVDTTSAGDSFIGGFCSALCEGKSIDDAVYYASAVSSITIGRAGASVSIPTVDEVKDFLSKNTMRPRN